MWLTKPYWNVYTVARNVLSTVFSDVGVCTDDFSQKVNNIKLAAYVLDRQTVRK